MLITILTHALLLLLAGITLAYLWAVRRNGYWARNRVAHIRGVPFLGSLTNLVLARQSTADLFRQIYENPLFATEPVVGIEYFHQPALMVRDPQLVKQLLIKDFDAFSERYVTSDPHDTLGSTNLFLCRNPLWRRIRNRLAPFFSGAKLRNMFPLISDIGNQMDAKMLSVPLDDPSAKSFVTEAKDFAARYTTDVIASCAYGVNANSLNDPNSEFRRNGREVFDFNLYRTIEMTAIFYLPQIVSFFRFRLFAKGPTRFIRETFNYEMEERQLSGTKRNDLIDTLIEIQNDDKLNSDGALSVNVLVAQAGVFFTAGFETSSTTMSFALYELAKHPDIQKRLRLEIRETLLKNNGTLTYDSINSMQYMHMVVSEVLRLHPILPYIDRKCSVSKSGYSLQPWLDFTVPRGMPIHIPIAAIQRDAKYYPHPDRFDPERFAPANKANLIPYTFMPFGIGPHNCIGERFGWLQSKVGLSNFLRNHYVTPTKEMPREVRYASKALFLQSDRELYLNAVRDPLL